MGPVVTSLNFARTSYLEIARSEGVDIVAGGQATNLFFEPTVLTGVTTRMRVAQEEIFGPVVGVIEVADLDEAIAVTNDSPFGLCGAIVTNDLRAAMRFADEAEVGLVKINRPTTGLDLNAPFGGVKRSSSGTFREQGNVAVDFYTRLKTVYVGT